MEPLPSTIGLPSESIMTLGLCHHRPPIDNSGAAIHTHQSSPNASDEGKHHEGQVEGSMELCKLVVRFRSYKSWLLYNNHFVS